VYRQLAQVSMTGCLKKPLEENKRKYALQFPLTVVPEGELLERLRRDPHISYIKPITWMPLLPIKSNVVMSYDTIDELEAGMTELSAYTNDSYIADAYKAFEQF
jgi:hypothetical protein